MKTKENTTPSFIGYFQRIQESLASEQDSWLVIPAQNKNERKIGLLLNLEKREIRVISRRTPNPSTAQSHSLPESISTGVELLPIEVWDGLYLSLEENLFYPIQDEIFRFASNDIDHNPLKGEQESLPDILSLLTYISLDQDKLQAACPLYGSGTRFENCKNSADKVKAANLFFEAGIRLAENTLNTFNPKNPRFSNPKDSEFKEVAAYYTKLFLPWISPSRTAQSCVKKLRGLEFSELLADLMNSGLEPKQLWDYIDLRDLLDQIPDDRLEEAYVKTLLASFLEAKEFDPVLFVIPKRNEIVSRERSEILTKLLKVDSLNVPIDRLLILDQNKWNQLPSCTISISSMANLDYLPLIVLETLLAFLSQRKDVKLQPKIRKRLESVCELLN